MRGACLLESTGPVATQTPAWKSAASAATMACCCAVLRFSCDTDHLKISKPPGVATWICYFQKSAKWSWICQVIICTHHVPCRNTLNTPRLMSFPKHTVLTSNSSYRCLSLSRASCISSCFAVLSEANFLAPCIRLSPVTDLFQHGRASTFSGQQFGGHLAQLRPKSCQCALPY